MHTTRDLALAAVGVVAIVAKLRDATDHLADRVELVVQPNRNP